MKIIKLEAEEYRRHRNNAMRVVDEKGTPVRDVRQVEVKAFITLDATVKQTRRAEKAIFEEEDGKETLIEVTPALVAPGTYGLKRTIDGMTVVNDREIMYAEILAKHGPCQVRTMAGQPKFTVRHAVSANRSAAGAASGTPHPDTCPNCSQYAGRQPGRHHFICAHNAAAPPDERGDKTAVVMTAQPAGVNGVPMPAAAPAPKLRFVPSSPNAPALVPMLGTVPPNAPQGSVPFLGSAPAAPAFVPPFLGGAAAAAMPNNAVPVVHTTPLGVPGVLDTTGVVAPPAANVAVVATPPAVIAPPAPPPPVSPQGCPNNCTLWAQYKNDGHHHHICGHKKTWEDAQAGQVPRYLVHLETSMVLREATADEIAQAAETLGIAEVAGESYGVLTMEQLTATMNAPEAPVVVVPDAPAAPVAVAAPAPSAPVEAPPAVA